MSDTTEAQLNVVFSKSTDFVDIRALRDIVAPNDIRDAAKLIETKKLRDVRTQLESNGVVAVRASSNGKFEVHVDLALEYILYRNKDLKQFVTSIRNNRPGGIRGVLESTPGLFERVKTVFGDNGIRHVRLEGKFYFAAPDLARLVLWDSERKTPSIKNAARDVHLAAVKDTLLAGELLRTFQFGYGNDTPILDIRGAARLWACLPGARASAFRTTLVDTWVRVFGGDESLVDDIRRNRQVQENLPQDHPGMAFGDAIRENHLTEHQAMSLVIPDVQAAIQAALAPFTQRLEEERAARLALENALEVEKAARVALTNTLKDEQAARTALSVTLEEEKATRAQLQTACIEMSEEIAGVRTAQRIEYGAEAFDDIETLDLFVAAPMATAVRFKDLFRFMGVIGVKEEVSMACGRVTHRMAPRIGHRKQRGRDGREYVTIDYRKSQAPVMLRGIMAVCMEYSHSIDTEYGKRCWEARNLMTGLRR